MYHKQTTLQQPGRSREERRLLEVLTQVGGFPGQSSDLSIFAYTPGMIWAAGLVHIDPRHAKRKEQLLDMTCHADRGIISRRRDRSNAGGLREERGGISSCRAPSPRCVS